MKLYSQVAGQLKVGPTQNAHFWRGVYIILGNSGNSDSDNDSSDSDDHDLYKRKGIRKGVLKPQINTGASSDSSEDHEYDSSSSDSKSARSSSVDSARYTGTARVAKLKSYEILENVRKF